MVKRDGTTLQCLVCGDIVHQAAAAGDDGEVELVAGAVSPPPDAEQEVRASSDLAGRRPPTIVRPAWPSRGRARMPFG
jgi:hypothetical protein